MAVAGGRGRNYGGGPEGGRACNSPRVTRPATSMKAAAAVAVAGGGGGENDRVRIKPCLPSRSHQGPGWRLVEADPVEALQELGPISCVAVMPKKRQVLVEFEDVLGVGGHELRSFRSIWRALQLLSVILPTRKYPAPRTRRTLGAPTVGFSLPSGTTSVTFPGTFFILSVTLVVLPRELWFSGRMASRPWRTVCSVPSELRPYSPGLRCIQAVALWR